MTLPTKIVVIGAGSASFGENTLAALVRSRKLRGSTLALVDRNPEMLNTVKRLAERLNHEWDSQLTITAHTDHREALDGKTEFVVSAIEVGAREGLWRRDYEIPLQFGVRQPYAENGGPGGFAHALRNIGPVLGIARDMEQTCPGAWFINYTNPMIRICDLVNRHTRIKAVGLCHQIFIGYVMVGIALGCDLGLEIPQGIVGMHADITQAPLHDQVKEQIVPRLDIRAAGLNHFSWILSIRDRQTGEDLYPLFRRRFFELDPAFEPLTRRVFEAFGLFPVPGDTHLCEYLPWVSDPLTQPWEKYHLHLYDWDMNAAVREFQHERLRRMANQEMTIEGLEHADSEGALEMIENIAGAGTHYHLAANLPNRGQIDNLPIGATVETPVVVDGAGIHPVLVGALPEPVAELLRRETAVAQLCVEAAVEGSHEKAYQCLLLDPVITDIETARSVLDAYLTEYKEYLPQFRKSVPGAATSHRTSQEKEKK
ncbi:MAG: alpha-glucosidase/alpha-galactosidase [Anaerolineales bacterium]|nr:alpha-glucosidase/alpha-galactosidase [Anaerolineales bacterium]